MPFFIDFCSNFNPCCKSQHQKNVRPRSVLLAFHTIQRYARCMHFWLKKPSKNHPKMTSEPFKNRCKKRDVFYHRFFGALASIWKPFDLQVGAKLLSWTPKTLPKAFKIQVFWEHVSKMLPKRLQSGSKRVPRRAQRSIFR